MNLDFFLITASVTLMLLSAVLITMFAMLIKSLSGLGSLLRGLQGELSPLASDLRSISVNLVAASEGLNLGIQRASRMTEAMGKIGDDLEAGRSAVKGSLEGIAQLAGPWMALLKLFGRK